MCIHLMWYYKDVNKSAFAEVLKVKNVNYPDPNVIHPIAGYDKEIYVKPTITNPILTCSDLAKVKAELEKRLEADSDDFIEDIHDPCLRFQR